ncbi:hypothetical protein QHH11_10660 [Aphanizomenon sp. PH219]|nr:hypothetical protein [Aphanizomenon sp. 202]MDK2459592.1 hypothetical protein [Aphanizomenon sp. PH219]
MDYAIANPPYAMGAIAFWGFEQCDNEALLRNRTSYISKMRSPYLFQRGIIPNLDLKPFYRRAIALMMGN